MPICNSIPAVRGIKNVLALQSKRWRTVFHYRRLGVTGLAMSTIAFVPLMGMALVRQFTATQSRATTASPAPLPPVPPFSNGAIQIHAMWLWQTQDIISQTNTILQFANQQGVNTIYLQFNGNVPTENYQNFIQNAFMQHISVVALDGDPSWALTANEPQLTSFINQIAEYNQSVRPYQRFQGINLDIEPYIMSEWATNQEAVDNQYLQNIEDAVALGHKNRLPVSGAIPFWFYTLPMADGNLGQDAIRTFDYVDVMAYRAKASGPNGIEAMATPEVKIAQQQGKPVVIALDTSPSGAVTSFYGTSEANLEQQRNAAMSNLEASYSSVVGWAVNDYTNWSILVNQSSTPST